MRDGSRERGSEGGPGTKDPGRYSFHSATTLDFLVVGYGVETFQISSKLPLDREHFDFDARVPEGATKPEFAMMLQRLLAERFHLKLHHVQREFNAGRYHRAVDALTDAVAKSPDDAQLHFLLGQCYYELREFTRAVTSFERSVQLVPNQSEYHDWLGKAYGRRAEETDWNCCNASSHAR